MHKYWFGANSKLVAVRIGHSLKVTAAKINPFIVESFFSSSVARMTPKETTSVITNPWFALMAKYHVTTAWCCHGISWAAKSCQKAQKAGLRISMGVRRRQREVAPLSGSRKGEQHNPAVTLWLQQPPRERPAEAQAGAGRDPAAVVGDTSHPTMQLLVCGARGTRQNPSVPAHSPISVLAALCGQKLPQIKVPSQLITEIE